MCGFGLKPKDQFSIKTVEQPEGRLSLRRLTPALRSRIILNGQISFLIACITHISSWWSRRPRRSLHRRGEPVRPLQGLALQKDSCSHSQSCVCHLKGCDYITLNEKISDYFSWNPVFEGSWDLFSTEHTSPPTHSCGLLSVWHCMILAKVLCRSIFVLLLVAKKPASGLFQRVKISQKQQRLLWSLHGCTQDNSQARQRLETTNRSHDANVS